MTIKNTTWNVRAVAAIASLRDITNAEVMVEFGAERRAPKTVLQLSYRLSGDSYGQAPAVTTAYYGEE